MFKKIGIGLAVLGAVSFGVYGDRAGRLQRLAEELSQVIR